MRVGWLLAEIAFDCRLGVAAESFQEDTGRKGLPPGVYFRMLFIGYFEGITSERGIVWRCEGSRSLARYLGHLPGQSAPDLSTLSVTRNQAAKTGRSLRQTGVVCCEG